MRQSVLFYLRLQSLTLKLTISSSLIVTLGKIL